MWFDVLDLTFINFNIVHHAETKTQNMHTVTHIHYLIQKTLLPSDIKLLKTVFLYLSFPENKVTFKHLVIMEKFKFEINTIISDTNKCNVNNRSAINANANILS